MQAPMETTDDVPYFNLGDPEFDVTSPEVHRARERTWYVRTNYGHAVLRYDEMNQFLKDRRFRQGNAQWPAQNGIHSGEIEGKDASLALMRDIVVLRSKESLLDSVIVLILPIYSVDAHERRRRLGRPGAGGDWPP